jgi:hypothetical protein
LHWHDDFPQKLINDMAQQRTDITYVENIAWGIFKY